MREVVFNGSDFLGGKEDPWGIQEEIECMFCHGFGIVGVILGYIDVEIHEVIIMPAEQLKLEFIINLNQRVDPVHISYK